LPGKRITQRQESLYMNTCESGKSQETAAAKAVISEHSGRRIEKGERPSIPGERHWRTREDPFEAIWEKELVPLLEQEAQLTGLTLWKYLEDEHAGKFPYRCCEPFSVASNIGKPRKGRIRSLSFASLYPLASKVYPTSVIRLLAHPCDHLYLYGQRFLPTGLILWRLRCQD
jgi:hypothetical protein